LAQPSATFSGNEPIARALHALWRWLLVEGVVLLVLGALAIVLPLVAGLAATVILGWLLLAAGVVGLIASISARQAPGFGWALLSAILAIGAGVVLLWNPAAGLATLTIVMIAYFIADGISMIVLAIAHRRELSQRWEWMLVNGIIDLVLAAILILGLPGTLVWALGLLLGIDLVMGGAALIAMALGAKRTAAG
jgi:uncharacterized membrane protein HdeD (DUF308 family)